MMEPLPTFALQIQEARVVEEECTPSFLFACDDETVIQQWQSEMLAVALRLARSGRKESDSYVPWTQRGGGYINEGASDIAGRAMVLCGQYISRWGLYTGEFIEQSMAVAGGWSTSKAAGLLDSAKQKEAERLGSKAGQVAGGVVSTVMQWSCSAVTRLGHTVGGAGYPSYSSRCRGRSHEEVGGDLEDCNTARLYICEVCSASPIVDKGCRLCAIRFCEDCWQAHTQPPTVEKHSSMYAKLNETDARSVENTISNQKKQEAKWRQTQVMALRAALAKVASPPLRDADALRAPPHTDARLRDWPSSRTWSLTPIRNPTLLRGLSDCLKTDPAKLQRGGRDVGIAPMHKKLKLVAAWDLKHEVLWKKYVQGALEVTCQRSQAPGANPQIPLRNECISGDRTVADWAVALGTPLRHDINEKLVAHGTKSSKVLSIIAFGPNERYCSQRASFGKGIYAAEDIGKCDQYCEEDDGTAVDAESQEFYKQVYADCGISHPCQDTSCSGDSRRGVCYVLICRAVLGTSIHSKDGKTCQQTGKPLWIDHSDRPELCSVPHATPPHPYHSLVMEADPSGRKGGYMLDRYREMVIYHGERVYPQFLVAYERQM
eukprot:TRINITY_DN31148_c0_g1_i9.p1 TRINITY_DN31148_c0_g1~~TRINITY_DN31148_c0_g1_i9.p1  ORF type:complete len:603 (+),score=61.55 TRINITY_DN31148_c0_g1_i9:132-1940(+)